LRSEVHSKSDVSRSGSCGGRRRRGRRPRCPFVSIGLTGRNSNPGERELIVQTSALERRELDAAAIDVHLSEVADVDDERVRRGADGRRSVRSAPAQGSTPTLRMPAISTCPNGPSPDGQRTRMAALVGLAAGRDRSNRLHGQAGAVWSAESPTRPHSFRRAARQSRARSTARSEARVPLRESGSPETRFRGCDGGPPATATAAPAVRGARRTCTSGDHLFREVPRETNTASGANDNTWVNGARVVLGSGPRSGGSESKELFTTKDTERTKNLFEGHGEGLQNWALRGPRPLRG
jgi:hypothetical protein